jgi:hypothetical protein
VIVTATHLALPLSTEWDGVGLVLVITDQGGVQATDSAFDRHVPAWSLADQINYRLQHWRHVDEPVLDSGAVSGSTVTLWWRNFHQDRDVDSTIVYRNGQQRKLLDHTFETWSDTGVAPGTHTYTLKHFTTTLIGTGGLANPNSAKSANYVATVSGLIACATAEYLSTWKVADQYLSAGCSSLGGSIRYRWFRNDLQTPLTGWSTDTLFDFLGLTGIGTQRVLLKDSNTTTGTTALDTLTFTVTNSQVTLYGPTWVTDKSLQTYTASGSHAGHWFERYDDGPQWYPATSVWPVVSMTRIWPAGEYTVDLRQHLVSGGVLHRGRLLIEMCYQCGGGLNVTPPPGAASAGVAASDWGFFGAGPWLSWGSGAGREVLRLYDLAGRHDRESAFSDAGWFSADGGTFEDGETGWDLKWTPLEVGIADARAIELSVSGDGGRPYVLGFAADPDLGPNAADDAASYDRERGMVLVVDQARAIGILLRNRGENALASVQEYGVGRFAPATAEGAWQAQRATGPRLVGTPRDVQLVLSAAPASGPASWLLLVVRGAGPADVRARADQVLRTLR